MDEFKKDSLNTPKSMVSEISSELLLEVGNVFTLGAEKYGRSNYLKCGDTTPIKDALLRHTYQYLSGVYIDEESKQTHLAHIVANVNMLHKLESAQVKQKISKSAEVGCVNTKCIRVKQVPFDDYAIHTQELHTTATYSSCEKEKVGAMLMLGNDQSPICSWNYALGGGSCENEDNATLSNVIHAEVGCIVNALADGVSPYGKTMLITKQPCDDCLDFMGRYGIKRYSVLPRDE